MRKVAPIDAADDVHMPTALPMAAQANISTMHDQ